MLAAALLHDVGKLDAHLRTYGRVVATLAGGVVGHDQTVIRQWTLTTGFTRRVGLYLIHPSWAAICWPWPAATRSRWRGRGSTTSRPTTGRSTPSWPLRCSDADDD